MTTPTLQSQLRLLAPDGTHDGGFGDIPHLGTKPDDGCPVDCAWLPGASGTILSEEGMLVLGWLAKAGYTWRNETYHQLPFGIRLSASKKRVYGHGDTLEAALTAAILALELAT